MPIGYPVCAEEGEWFAPAQTGSVSQALKSLQLKLEGDVMDSPISGRKTDRFERGRAV
jgi:hypothetical protein